MIKLTYRKSPTYFSSKCYFKDIVKNSNEKDENCWSYAACRFEKSCFEKNAFKVLKCLIEQCNALGEEFETTRKKIL